MKENAKKECEIVVDTVVKVVLQMLDEESELADGFDVMYTVEEQENGVVNVTLNATKDYTRTPNHVDGQIESYNRDEIWDKTHFMVLDYKNLAQVYKTVKTELYGVTDTYAENIKFK